MRFAVEVGELCAERLALPQGGVVGDVLSLGVSKYTVECLFNLAYHGGGLEGRGLREEA